MNEDRNARYLAAVVVLVLAVVASRWGGYDPWAVLILELGAIGLWLVPALAWLLRKERDAEARIARLRAFRKLSFWVRHSELAGIVRFVTLGRLPNRRESAEFEIVLPGAQGARSIELDPAREVFLLGHPVKRTGLLAPLALISLWIVLSLVPIDRGWHDLLSPAAAQARSQAEALAEHAPAGSVPTSLAPFLTFDSFWLWLSILALFAVSLRVARRPDGASRLALLLLLLGALSGGWAMVGLFSDLAEAYGATGEAFRARGAFGNPNHFATFQSMLLLVSLGWLSSFRASRRGASTKHPRHRSARDRSSLAFIAGMAILFLALGLVLSLSRGGIASAIAGVACFIVLTRRAEGEARGRRQAVLTLLAVGVAVASFALWIGIEPLVGRFANLGEQWQNEGTRIRVWRDSAPALLDFSVTGSGLSTFRYVGSRYRTFGGVTFYSWAHNDFLQLGIELGVPGLLLLAWIASSVVRTARRIRADLAEEPDRLQLHAGFLSAIAAAAFHSATDFSLHLPANLALLAVIVGAVVGMERRGR